MALGARKFNFFKFLSLYSHNIEGHPTMLEVTKLWWKTMDKGEKHMQFSDDEQKYIDFIQEASTSTKYNLIIAPNTEEQGTGILLWWTYPSQKFHVPYPNKAFREKLLKWMGVN